MPRPRLHQKQLWSDLYDEAARSAALLELSLPWLEAIDTDVNDDTEECLNLFRLQLEVAGVSREEQLTSLLAMLERLAADVRAESSRRISPQQVDPQWLRSLPLEELRKRGHLQETRDPEEQQREILTLFDVADIDAWHSVWEPVTVMFRRSNKVAEKLGSIATWLRLGELAARDVHVEPYDAHKLRQTLDDLLHQSRAAAKVYIPEIQQRCAEAGVVVLFIPEIPGAGIHAVARVLHGTPVIQLGLRYRTDDLLWFNLMHEAAHVLLHADNLNDCNTMARDECEDEANAFAQNMLIPPNAVPRLRELRSAADVTHFADELGIAAGIVVGRLQHEGLWPYRMGNDLKRRLAWRVEGSQAFVTEVGG